jgi:hypothetical protein
MLSKLKAKYKPVFDEAIGTLLGLIIGWVFCVCLLWGVFWTSLAVAGWFGETKHLDALGVIGTICFIWIYERLERDDKARRKSHVE